MQSTYETCCQWKEHERHDVAKSTEEEERKKTNHSESTYGNVCIWNELSLIFTYILMDIFCSLVRFSFPCLCRLLLSFFFPLCAYATPLVSISASDDAAECISMFAHQTAKRVYWRRRRRSEKA